MRAAVSLYSGLGAGALGAQQAGYEVTACVERDRHALATLWANGLPAVEADTLVWDTTPYRGTTDLVIGGPPCQPFSAAGRQTGESDPRDCIPHFIRIVDEIRPRLFVLENVRGLTFKRNSVYLAHVLESFPAVYNVTYAVLNAADYGVPQTRRRLFIVGRADAPAALPEPPHHRHITMGEALGWGEVQVQTREPAGDINGWPHLAGTVSLQRRNNNAPPVDVLAFPSPTVTVSAFGVSQWNIYDTRGPEPVRIKPTVSDVAKIQGLPGSWTFPVPGREAFKQIGNACPPALIQAVIEANG